MKNYSNTDIYCRILLQKQPSIFDRGCERFGVSNSKSAESLLFIIYYIRLAMICQYKFQKYKINLN